MKKGLCVFLMMAIASASLNFTVNISALSNPTLDASAIDSKSSLVVIDNDDVQEQRENGAQTVTEQNSASLVTTLNNTKSDKEFSTSSSSIENKSGQKGTSKTSTTTLNEIRSTTALQIKSTTKATETTNSPTTKTQTTTKASTTTITSTTAIMRDKKVVIPVYASRVTLAEGARLTLKNTNRATYLEYHFFYNDKEIYVSEKISPMTNGYFDARVYLPKGDNAIRLVVGSYNLDGQILSKVNQSFTISIV